jgi:hypothetical protein
MDGRDVPGLSQLYILPMGDGFGLCNNSPHLRPILLSVEQHYGLDFPKEITDIPACIPGKAPSMVGFFSQHPKSPRHICICACAYMVDKC